MCNHTTNVILLGLMFRSLKWFYSHSNFPFLILHEAVVSPHLVLEYCIKFRLFLLCFENEVDCSEKCKKHSWGKPITKSCPKSISQVGMTDPFPKDPPFQYSVLKQWDSECLDGILEWWTPEQSEQSEQSVNACYHTAK